MIVSTDKNAQEMLFLMEVSHQRALLRINLKRCMAYETSVLTVQRMTPRGQSVLSADMSVQM